MKENTDKKQKTSVKQKLKQACTFAVLWIPCAAIGGYFTGKYAYASYAAEVQQMILQQLGSVQILAVVSMVQSVIYAVVCAILGYLLADALGLMRPVRLEKQKLFKTIAITAVCGVLFSLDYWVFGKVIPQVAEFYQSGLLVRNADNWIASVFYGGVVEELLLRLFFLSLVAYIVWKGFFRKYEKEQIPAGVFVFANVFSALVFAAGHLPATISMFGGLNVWILMRCFLLNGGLGMVFGHLYKKYGIQYAFIAHAGAHTISKIIWLLFL